MPTLIIWLPYYLSCNRKWESWKHNWCMWLLSSGRKYPFLGWQQVKIKRGKMLHLTYPAILYSKQSHTFKRKRKLVVDDILSFIVWCNMDMTCTSSKMKKHKSSQSLLNITSQLDFWFSFTTIEILPCHMFWSRLPSLTY